MKLRSALLAATILAAAPVVARAQQPVTGLYVGAGAGANFMQDENLKSSTFTQQAVPTNIFSTGRIGGKTQLQDGFVGLASIGYGFGNGLRAEVEGSYRQNKFQKIGSGAFASGAGGDEMKYGGMVNVLYDFNPSLLGLGFLPVVPYIGAGVGYQWAQDRNGHFYGNTGPLAGVPGGYNNLFRSDDGDGSFAYQAIVGVSFPIPSVPGLALTAEYRFMGMNDDRTYNYQFYATGPTRGGINTRSKITFNDDYNHSILVGVRYAFNAAPPPVAVVAPPPVRESARTYLVFFDWDRADLTDRARQIISEAAQATTRVQVTRILVNGYTDLSGTARYNQGLSVRRATNVANELVRDGVPRAAIATHGYGEANPLVPTAQGVREPQNRRVEIILQ